MPLNFWKGMFKRTDSGPIKSTDKLMIGNIDTGLPEYIDVSELVAIIQSGGVSSAPSATRKDGYRWLRGAGNTGTAYRIGDEIIGVGTLFPGFVVHGYCYANPSGNTNQNPNEYFRILSSVKQ